MAYCTTTHHTSRYQHGVNAHIANTQQLYVILSISYTEPSDSYDYFIDDYDNTPTCPFGSKENYTTYDPSKATYYLDCIKSQHPTVYNTIKQYSYIQLNINEYNINNSNQLTPYVSICSKYCHKLDIVIISEQQDDKTTYRLVRLMQGIMIPSSEWFNLNNTYLSYLSSLRYYLYNSGPGSYVQYIPKFGTTANYFSYNVSDWNEAYIRQRESEQLALYDTFPEGTDILYPIYPIYHDIYDLHITIHKHSALRRGGIECVCSNSQSTHMRKYEREYGNGGVLMYSVDLIIELYNRSN